MSYKVTYRMGSKVKKLDRPCPICKHSLYGWTDLLDTILIEEEEACPNCLLYCVHYVTGNYKVSVMDKVWQWAQVELKFSEYEEADIAREVQIEYMYARVVYRIMKLLNLESTLEISHYIREYYGGAV